jgi:hypothetical protein
MEASLRTIAKEEAERTLGRMKQVVEETKAAKEKAEQHASSAHAQLEALRTLHEADKSTNEMLQAENQRLQMLVQSSVDGLMQQRMVDAEAGLAVERRRTTELENSLARVQSDLTAGEREIFRLRRITASSGAETGRGPAASRPAGASVDSAGGKPWRGGGNGGPPTLKALQENVGSLKADLERLRGVVKQCCTEAPELKAIRREVALRTKRAVWSCRQEEFPEPQVELDSPVIQVRREGIGLDPAPTHTAPTPRPGTPPSRHAPPPPRWFPRGRVP